MATIQGNNNNNNLTGGSGSDEIDGKGGNDKLYGKGGQDTLYGQDGQDSLYGGDGQDILYGADGNDFLDGGKKADTLRGSSGNDTLNGDEGQDKLYGGIGNDILYGGDGDDIFRAGFSGTTGYNYGDIDVWYGNSGNDIFNISHGYHLSSTDYVTIKDFTLGQDTINIGSLNKSSILLQQTGNSVYIRYGNTSNTIAIVENSNTSIIRSHLGLPNQAPIAVNDSYTINENTSSIFLSVLNNDYDPDGVTVSLISQTSSRANTSGNNIIYNIGNQFNYLRQGQTYQETFSYTIQDSNGATDSATVRVTITGVNDIPNAVNDIVTTNENNSSVYINVLANDFDLDQRDTLSLISENSNSAYISGNQIIYDATKFNSLGAGQTGVDTFNYTIRDSAGATRTASITVNVAGVNDAPTAENDNANTNEDSIININVLGNDVDPDQGDSKFLVSVNSSNIQGKVAIVNNQIQYDPRNVFDSLKPGEQTQETFSYTMRDAAGVTSSASVTVTVTGLNDSPILFISGNPTIAPEGSTVGEIVVDNSITDADNIVDEAIAIIEVSTLNGKWQYFHNNQWQRNS